MGREGGTTPPHEPTRGGIHDREGRHSRREGRHSRRNGRRDAARIVKNRKRTKTEPTPLTPQPSLEVVHAELLPAPAPNGAGRRRGARNSIDCSPRSTPSVGRSATNHSAAARPGTPGPCSVTAWPAGGASGQWWPHWFRPSLHLALDFAYDQMPAKGDRTQLQLTKFEQSER